MENIFLNAELLSWTIDRSDFTLAHPSLVLRWIKKHAMTEPWIDPLFKADWDLIQRQNFLNSSLIPIDKRIFLSEGIGLKEPLSVDQVELSEGSNRIFSKTARILFDSSNEFIALKYSGNALPKERRQKTSIFPRLTWSSSLRVWGWVSKWIATTRFDSIKSLIRRHDDILHTIEERFLIRRQFQRITIEREINLNDQEKQKVCSIQRAFRLKHHTTIVSNLCRGPSSGMFSIYRYIRYSILSSEEKK